jgi:hypothetical protein
MTESKVITVYVRRPRANNDAPDCRSLAFQAVDEIPQKVALQNGFAIDGNSYTLDVTASWVDAGSPEAYFEPLSEALRNAQVKIANLLGEHGYEVTFS